MMGHEVLLSVSLKYNSIVLWFWIILTQCIQQASLLWNTQGVIFAVMQSNISVPISMFCYDSLILPKINCD